MDRVAESRDKHDKLIIYDIFQTSFRIQYTPSRRIKNVHMDNIIGYNMTDMCMYYVAPLSLRLTCVCCNSLQLDYSMSTIVELSVWVYT